MAHFLIRALSGEPISVYGSGKQVRDVLHVADAVSAYRTVLERIAQVNGQTFNLGGGVDNAISLRMLLEEIHDVTGGAPAVEWNDWRPGDQRYFVADTRRLQRRLGWTANTGWRHGLRHLAGWLRAERGLGRATQKERLTA